MLPGNLFRLQLASAFSDRRQTLLRLGASILLAFPFLLIRMPARVQATGITMIILFTSFFGAAVSHAHLRIDGRLTRLSLLPTSRWVLWLDLILSSVMMRLGSSGIVLGAFVVANSGHVTAAILLNLAGLLCVALVLLTLLGMGTGRLARSNAEVHLFGALATGMLAMLSGVAPLPVETQGPGALHAWSAAITAWNPIAWLLTALNRLALGSTAIPRLEFTLSCLALGTVVVGAVLRWRSGGMQKGSFNARDIVIGDRAPMEV